MIFQTILDPNEVLLPIKNQNKIINKKVDAKIVYGIEGKDGKFRMLSVFSTNPQDYLGEKYIF